MNKLIAFLPLFALVPMSALAQEPELGNVNSFFTQIADIVANVLVPLVFALAIVAFFWGLLKMLIWGGADEEKRKEGKKLMLWSIIALAVMVLIYGIIELLGVLFGINPATIVPLPQAPLPQ